MGLYKTTKEQPRENNKIRFLFVNKYFPQLLNERRRENPGMISSINPQIRLSIDEIAYIRYDSRMIQRGYISVVTTEGETYYKRCSLNKILTISPYLVQISRNVIVHILNIAGYKSYGHEITTGGHSLTVSPNYLDDFQRKIKTYYM